MERAIIFTITYFCLCLVFFLFLQKPVFYFFNKSLNKETIKFKDIRNIFLYGAKTDVISATYLTILPMFCVWLQTQVNAFSCYYAMLCINIIISLIFGISTIADTVLYKFWQFKLDSSVFSYLKSFKGAFASVSLSYIVKGIIATLIISGLFFAGTYIITQHLYSNISIGKELGISGHITTFLIFMFLCICCFGLIRGLNIRPNTPSIAYHSKNPFYNHCAVNPLYNLIYSATSLKDEFKGQFRHFNNNEHKAIIEAHYPTTGAPKVEILKTTRPNILLIVWESLSANFMRTLGGSSDVAINMDRLSEEGILFTRYDSGSFRTDRGLVCLLCGYPGQPTTSVIKYPRKLENLPALPRILKNEGYTTTAVHGGDLSIMHKSTFYLTSGHDTLVSQKDFPSSAPSGKWGIHDDYMFNWLFEDIQRKEKENTRWFTTFQTLSSHEPFIVPFDRLKDDKIANSFAYTDHCFGEFIDKLKKTPAWDNLLIICSADHGCNANNAISRSDYAHIPLLMLGGAIKKPMKVDNIMSQMDLAATLLGQMQLPHKEFIFSRDIFSDTYTKPFSFHTYNNGFFIRDEKGYTDYDNIADAAIEGKNKEREELGKAILQTLYEDLNNR